MSVEDVEPTSEIEYKGMTLILGRTSFDTEAQFAKWVRLKAFASVKDIPDPSLRKDVLAGIAGDIASGKYTYDTPGGNYVKDSLRSMDGLKEWLFLTARQRTPMLISGDGRRWFDDLWNAPLQEGAPIDKESGLPLTPQDQVVVSWMEINSPNPQTPTDKTTDQ